MPAWQRSIHIDRPHYPPTERLAILKLKAARGWSLEQTARVFQVTAPSIASWRGRLNEDGPDALVQMQTPVNRFPDFVRDFVQRGKVKIAQTLTRAGLHLCAATVGRTLKEEAQPFTKESLNQHSPPIIQQNPWLTICPYGHNINYRNKEQP
jgi:transposase-like protein